MPLYPRLTCVLIFAAAALVARAHAPAVDMREAAHRFLSGLDAAQRKTATYTLTDAERENWNFVPIARQGLPLKKMSPAQRETALALLRTGAGQRGLTRVNAIMSMELVLKEIEKDTPPGRRDPEQYFITIFGEPSDTKSWGWRFEGHHLAFNFTVVDGSHVFFAPSFIGSNPAEVLAGPRKGERVLAEEEDRGLALINSLDATQRKTAIFATEGLKEIVTTNQKRVQPLAPTGLAAAQLTPSQRTDLVELIRVYATRWRPELAEEIMTKVTRDLDRVTFAWAGSLTRGKATYYRIQSPDFLIEFDNAQNNANHIHTVFRDFKGDFGHDPLAAHYAKEHAKP